jgi:hypothetical protein
MYGVQISFTWQTGYTAFTVSATTRESVRKYILLQEEHHRLRTSCDELIELLQKAGIEYGPLSRLKSLRPLPGSGGRCVTISWGIAPLNPRLMALTPAGVKTKAKSKGKSFTAAMVGLLSATAHFNGE